MVCLLPEELFCRRIKKGSFLLKALVEEMVLDACAFVNKDFDRIHNPAIPGRVEVLCGDALLGLPIQDSQEIVKTVLIARVDFWRGHSPE